MILFRLLSIHVLYQTARIDWTLECATIDTLYLRKKIHLAQNENIFQND